MYSVINKKKIEYLLPKLTKNVISKKKKIINLPSFDRSERLARTLLPPPVQ